MSIAEEDYWAQKSERIQSGQEHWLDHLTNFIDQGIDGFKLDSAHTLDEYPDREYYRTRLYTLYRFRKEASFLCFFIFSCGVLSFPERVLTMARQPIFG